MTRPLRVLHLEDHPADAAVIRDRLEFEGLHCEIRLTDSQARFESALAEETFDLIIADYHLPGYDGIAALNHALTTHPDVPVIMVSGTVSEEEAVKCLHFGATDYLLKGRLDRLAPGGAPGDCGGGVAADAQAEGGRQHLIDWSGARSTITYAGAAETSRASTSRSRSTPGRGSSA